MITLECIETFADGVGNQISFVEQAITRSVFTDDKAANITSAQRLRAGLTIGPGYFPLMPSAWRWCATPVPAMPLSSA